MAAAVEALRVRLPEQSQETIERAVYDVATELVSTITDPARLTTMLRLRATARLSASSGDPVAIARARPEPLAEPLPEPLREREPRREPLPGQRAASATPTRAPR
jgi:hypothetical protein